MPSTGRHRGPRASPPRRTRVAPVLGVLLLGSSLAVLVGAASAGIGTGTGSPAPSVTGAVVSLPPTRPPSPTGPARPAHDPSADTWAGVLATLDGRRSAAFAAGDLGALAAVYAGGSPAGARDRATLARLRAAGTTVRGLRPVLISVTLAGPRGASPGGRPGRVVLSVVDRLPGYVVVDAAGRSVARPPRAARRWSITLLRGSGGWRVLDIRAG